MIKLTSNYFHFLVYRRRSQRHAGKSTPFKFQISNLNDEDANNCDDQNVKHNPPNNPQGKTYITVNNLWLKQ